MSKSINFTKASLSALKTANQGKRDYYLDSNKKSTHLRGFGLVVNDKGSKHFVLTQYFKRDKKTVRLRCGEFPSTTIEQARIVAEEKQALLFKGIHPTEKRNEDAMTRALTRENDRLSSVTLETVLQDYLDNRELKQTTKDDYTNAISEVWSDYLSRPLLLINDDLVKKRYRKRLKSSVARANNCMRVLRALFNFAKIEYKLPDGSTIFNRNPVSVLSEGKTWHKVARRKRKIENDELQAWLESVNSLPGNTTPNYLKFLLFTGARRGEAARLLVEDVNFNSGVFTLRDTKNGSDVTLPMSDYVREVLTNAIETDQKWVFKSPMNDSHIKDPRKQIQRVIEESGVEFSLHDLRRTFISTAERLDISFYAIKALVNHKTGASSDVTEGYLNIADDYDRLASATQKITNQILSHAKQIDSKIIPIGTLSDSHVQN